MNARLELTKHQLGQLADRCKTSQEFRIGLFKLLRGVIPFHAACCTTVDPQTQLSTGAVTEEIVEDIHPQLFEYEYQRTDFNPYDQLVLSNVPVAALSHATQGDLDQSARYRDVLKPTGLGDELRAALRYDGVCWGYLTMFRREDMPLFQEAECQWIASLVPSIAYHIRQLILALPAAAPSEPHTGPGILTLTDQLDIIASNQAADDWLSSLRRSESIQPDILPRSIRAVCNRALAQAISSPERSQLADAKVCLHLPEGSFLTIQASLLHGPSQLVQLAVSFERARPIDLLPVLTEAYGLSERERHILDYILQGSSTRAIAASLHISAYTVQDHLKSIFVKTGVSSRRELTWQLFSRFQ